MEGVRSSTEDPSDSAYVTSEVLEFEIFLVTY
jgi:hypothetical protein